MPAKKAETGTDGFSAAERAAMKERAAELRAEGKKGAKQADALQAVLEAIAKMAPEDRGLAERVHAVVTAAAPGLAPKLWYGQPAWARDGKVICFLRSGLADKTRYSVFGFSESASLDEDGGMWPTSWAMTSLTP